MHKISLGILLNKTCDVLRTITVYNETGNTGDATKGVGMQRLTSPNHLILYSSFLIINICASFNMCTKSLSKLAYTVT